MIFTIFTKNKNLAFKGRKMVIFETIIFDHEDHQIWRLWSTQPPSGDDLFNNYGFYSHIWLSGHTVPRHSPKNIFDQKNGFDPKQKFKKNVFTRNKLF